MTLGGETVRAADARVCVVRQGLFPLDVRVRREVDALADIGHPVDVVCIRGSGERLYERSGSTRIYRLPISSRRGGIASYVGRYTLFLLVTSLVVSLLHLRRRYRLIQVHSLPDSLVFSAFFPRLLGVPVLLDLHECMPEFYATKFGMAPDSAVVRLLEQVEQTSIRFASSVLTCTEQMRELFVARGAPERKITIVLNSADEEIFRPHDTLAERQPHQFVVISHGTIEERYGLDTAIRATVLAAKEVPNLRLDIYGDGSCLGDLRNLAVELGAEHNVFFSGGYVPLDELVTALERADVGLVAVKKDRFRDVTHCNKMFEFIAMEKPAIVSRTRSVEHYFDDSCFLMFTGGDERQLAAAMVQLHRDPELRKRLAGRAAEVNQPYRWPQQRMRYLAVVQRLLDEGAARAVVGESRKGNSMESHWNRLGQAYEQEWNSPAKQALSRDELGFVARHIEGTSARRVLDVGIGTGRILGAILSQPRVEEVVGIDASEEMVEACKQAFSSHPKVQALQVCDVSSGDLPGETLFDFISAIRVLKYEKTWQEIVQKLVSRLNSGGALIFTIPNRRSLNLLSRRYAVPWYSTSKGEVLGLCEGLDVELIELISFTKLPFAFYNAAEGDLIGRVPPMLDRMLDLALGPRLLGREFFVALRRVSLK